MSFPYTPNVQDEKIESLRTQHEFLNLLRLRHQHWATSTDDPRIKQRHLEIAALLETLTDQYTHLLEAELRQRDTS